MIVNVCNVFSPTPAISAVLDDPIKMLASGNIEFGSRGGIVATWWK